MTPRTIESLLMDELLKDSQGFVENFVLTDERSVVDLLPPLVLRAKLAFQEDSSTPLSKNLHPEFYFNFFSTKNEFKSIHPHLPLYPGHPHRVAEFLFTEMEEVALDFGFGVAHISRKELSNADLPVYLHHHLLRTWLNYALSPELWGPEGKWPRFHQRLMTLCEKENILNGESKIGLYPLKKKAREWKNIQLEGNLEGETLILTLPWTFSLKALETLENFIGEEP